MYYILLNAGYRLDELSIGWYAVNFVAYVNLVLNPLMYAWQYETVRASARVLLHGARGQSHTQQAMASTRRGAAAQQSAENMNEQHGDL